MYQGVAAQLRRLFVSGTLTGLGEGALLDRYLDDRDGEAFEALVLRHGPMVLGVCRRFLDHSDDVDDAFQATFLVLARKAGSLRDRAALGPWLYGVAFKVATRARTRRRASPSALGTPDIQVGLDESPGAAIERDEEARALHEELARLPDNYRAPVVLCYLEGLTHDEAAAQLRWPVGTVRGRLARARDRLRDRLARRGVDASSFLVFPSTLRFPVLSVGAVRGASRLALASRSGPAGLATISPAVLSLSQEVLKVMAIKPMAWTLAVSVGLLTTAAGTVWSGAGGGQLPPINPTRPLEARPKASEADQKLGDLEKQVNDSLPRRPEEDTSAKIRAARNDYDQALVELAQEVVIPREEIDRYTIVSDSIKRRLSELAEQGLKLDRADHVDVEANAKITSESERLRTRLVEALKKTEAAKLRLSAIEKRLDELKRRPRPAERVEIQIGDLVIVEVLEALPGRPISGERAVRADGRISLGFYREVYVEGLTPEEAKEKIVLHLRRWLSNQTLGLIVTDADTGAYQTRAPRESDRVFVDITWPYPNRPDPREPESR